MTPLTGHDPNARGRRAALLTGDLRRLGLRVTFSRRNRLVIPTDRTQVATIVRLATPYGGRCDVRMEPDGTNTILITL